MAAGRRVSSEAISTLRLALSVRRLATLAVVVVLPEPCRPTIMMTTGAGALRSIGCASEPSVSMSSSCTILTTIWPGVTDLITSTPTARFFTSSMKARATSSATSASSSARRTSRSAASTSASDSAPRRVRRSRYRTQPFRQTVEHVLRPLERPSSRTAYANAFAPEGASRCRAVTSGLLGRSAVAIRSLARAGGK